MHPSAIAPVLPGETLAGKYRVERILGRGGMGVVVAARHLELDERVAIKFLLRKNDPIAVERFLREARAAAKVKSQHVCRAYDVGRLETGEPYLVMEYLDGVDLAERLAAGGPLGVELVARWIIEVCAALGEAHAHGIVHRDLKPANLFLAKRSDGTEHVKLLDFGISKLPSAEGMTATSATMGTPIYMSPEQVESARDVDARTDVWSLGVIMYELVSGKPPFAGDSLIQLSVNIRESEAPSLSGVAPDVPAGFEAIVAKCLAKDPAARWGSVGELASALAPFARITLEPSSQAGVDATPATRARWRWPVVALALAGGGLVIGLGTLPRGETTSPAASDAAPEASLPSSAPAPTVVPPATPTAAAAALSPSSPSSSGKPRSFAPVRGAVVDAGTPAVTSSTSPPTAAPSVEPPADPGRKRRPIDRSDPFAP